MVCLLPGGGRQCGRGQGPGPAGAAGGGRRGDRLPLAWQGRVKKEVCGQPAVEARPRARDGSRSRRGALAERAAAGGAPG
jgi:hypothetical protein